MHTYTPANSIFDGPVTNSLSVLCILTEIFSHAPVKGNKVIDDFKFGTFIGHFQSVSVASKAVKGLKDILL